MELLTDELLFYGGLAVAIGSLVIAAIFAIVSRIYMIRLNELFDKEYGKKCK